MRKHLNTLLAGAALIALPLVANAGPTYTFSTSTGVQPSDVGIITLTQIDDNTVNVLVDLKDTTLPAPQYGFLNTGQDNTHTAFVFNLSGTDIGVGATFSQPPLGVFSFGAFSLDLGGGNAVPFWKLRRRD